MQSGYTQELSSGKRQIEHKSLPRAAGNLLGGTNFLSGVREHFHTFAFQLQQRLLHPPPRPAGPQQDAGLGQHHPARPQGLPKTLVLPPRPGHAVPPGYPRTQPWLRHNRTSNPSPPPYVLWVQPFQVSVNLLLAFILSLCLSALWDWGQNTQFLAELSPMFFCP